MTSCNFEVVETASEDGALPDIPTEEDLGTPSFTRYTSLRRLCRAQTPVHAIMQRAMSILRGLTLQLLGRCCALSTMGLSTKRCSAPPRRDGMTGGVT